MQPYVYIVAVLVVAVCAMAFLWYRKGEEKKPDLKLIPCDKESMSGFVPMTWGPSVWKLIHIVSAAYPPKPTAQDKNDYVNFMQSLARVLPCGGCREHFTRALNEGKFKLTEDVLKSRMTVFSWSVAMHNSVNERLKKPVIENIDHWFNFYCQNRADYPIEPKSV